MKSLKIIKKIMPLLLLVTFDSCKKDKISEPETPQITADDLLGHYITSTLNANAGLRLIYFSKEGNVVKATQDQVSARRIQTVNIVDNTFTFDLDADNQKLYTFKLSKDDSGILKISSYSYKNQSDPSVVMNYAQIDKVADANAVLNGKVFAKTGVTNDYMIFFPDKWTWNTVPHIAAPPTLINYYVVSPGAWKSTSAAGIDYIGVNVPRWKDINEPVMLVQKAGIIELAIYKAM